MVKGIPTHNVPRDLCADALPFDFICVQQLRLNTESSLHALITSGTMLSTLWNSATNSPLAGLAVPSPAPSSSISPVASPASFNLAETGTPFTDFVLSRLPDEDSQKLFALSFSEHIRHDPDAPDLNFEDVHHWLGIPLKANALRLLKRELNAEEYLFIRDDEKSNGRPKDIYKISFNQCEELMIAAQTVEGRRARKLVLLLKKILQEYMVAELEQRSAALETLRLSESARANALQQQLEGLRAQQQHLYVFRLFGNRFKIGIAKDVDRRIRQHSTSCPSGHLVYSVPISCKAMEKLFESTMKQHGAWIRMEEYELSLSDRQISALFDVFARMEELLNTTPLDQYSTSSESWMTACKLARIHPLSCLSILHQMSQSTGLTMYTRPRRTAQEKSMSSPSSRSSTLRGAQKTNTSSSSKPRLSGLNLFVMWRLCSLGFHPQP